jgi:hypothetical protein
VIGEDDAAGTQLVDQACRAGGAGHLARALFPQSSSLMPPASRMPVAARCGRIWSSRTYVFFALPGSGLAALVWPWRHR